jgi:isoleucyl-tRNA synthetase
VQTVRDAVHAHQDDLLAELNIKALKVVADDGGLVTLSAKANFKVLGRKLGKRMKAVASAVAALTAEEVQAFVDAGSIELEGETLTAEDILIERTVAGSQAAEAGEGMTLLVDTEVSDALRKEGLAREVISRVQSLRKAADLDVSQTVQLVLSCDGLLAEVAQDEALVALIKGETLAEGLEHQAHAAPESLGTEHHAADKIDGEKLSIGLRV